MTAADSIGHFSNSGSPWETLQGLAEAQYSRRRHLMPAQRDLVRELEVHKIELEMQHDELRRAQQALDVSLERYSDLFDLAPISYLTLSEHGRIIDVNQAAARLLGVAQTALAGAPFHGFVLGEDQDLFYLHCRQLFRTGVSQAFEVRLSLPDGRLLVAWTEMSAAQGGAGQPVCRAVLSDVSDRRGQEMQMRLQNQALNSTSSGILFADTLGKIERVNLAFTELTGYRAADVEGKNLSQVFSLPVTVSELREAALLADWEGEVSTCATDNSRRHRLKISPVKDRFGQNTHLIAVLEPPLRGGARPVAVEKPLPKPMVAPAAETKSVKRGRVLFREGDRPGQLYRVKSGWVKLSRASLKGRDLIVDVLFPGDYFDIQSLLDGQPSSYTASTLRYFPAEIDYLPCQTALDDPHVKSALQQQLVSRMRHQQEMMSALATFRVEERVRLALRILARRAGSREGAERIVPMPLTRHELGEMIGATAEATIRALSDMQRRGLVRWVGRDLVCSAVVLEDRALCIN